MRWIYKLPARLRSLLGRLRAEQELDEELEFHIERRMEAEIARGVPPDEARYAAMRAVGNTSVVKEEVRDAWGWTLVNSMLQEIRYALRVLARSPGFTAVAIATLALGIAASTAMFTIVDTVVLKPLSYRDSGSLVALWERIPNLGPEPTGPNPRHVDIWRKGASSFRDIALLRQSTVGLTRGTDHPQIAGAVVASPNLFDVLQVTPLIGRTFAAGDDVEGREMVVILTYGVWQSLFAGDPDVVGKTVRIGDIPREVIGVLPADFHFPNRNSLRAFQTKQALTDVPEPGLFLPAVFKLDQFSWNGEYGNWIALARLKAGVSLQQAQAELDTLQKRVIEQIPAAQIDRDRTPIPAEIQPLQEAIVGRSRRILWFLMAAVGGLMLMACVNLANTQLARTYWRMREASVRLALGAPGWRLVWQSLVENVVIAAVAGAAGIALAHFGLEMFRRNTPLDLPRLTEVQLNPTVLLFALALTLGATLLVSVLPALYVLRSDPQAALQHGNHRALGRQRRGVQSWLVGVQVFGCTVLLLATGLFSRNLLQLSGQEMGFEARQAAFAHVSLTLPLYGPAKSRAGFIDAVLENVRAIPGVDSAGFISAAPLEGETWIESLQRVDRRAERDTVINLRWASGGYFETMRHRLVAGRFLEDRDREGKGAVITEGVARTLWPGESAVGGKVEVQGREYTVVGVVADARTASLKTPPPRVAYIHFAERAPAILFFVARGKQTAETLASDLRQAIWKHAPSATIVRTRTLEGQVRNSLGAERFQTGVITAFGVAALLIAMLGIYGVLSYTVATRKQEIGLRMAIGATPQGIYRLTFAEIAVPVVAGLAAGLVAILAAARVIGSMLDGMEGVHPAVAAGVAAVFLTCAALAGYVPARQAASVDPIQALRCD